MKLLSVMEFANNKIIKNQKFEDLSYHDSPNFISVQKQVSQFVISKENKDIKPNFCSTDPMFKRRFNIPDVEIIKFMNNIDKCRLNNIPLHFTELQQTSDDHTIGSGIMLDFDILTDSESDPIQELGFNELLNVIHSIIADVLEIPESMDKMYSYVMVIKKPFPMYKEKLQKYKHGMHILFPSIKVSRPVKKYIFNKILESEIAESFSDLGLDLSEILDKGSISVPVYLLGSCKTESVPYVVSKLYRLQYKHSSKKFTTANDIPIAMFNNIVLEFSLNYENPNGVVRKYTLLPKNNKIAEVQHFMTSNGIFDQELENVKNDIYTKSIYNSEIEHLQKLLSFLSLERLTERNSWRDVIFALTSGGDELKSLGIWVSKRVPGKYDSYGFEQIWADGIKFKGASRYTLKSISYWAKIDSPGLFDNFITDTLYQMITRDIKSKLSFGKIQHSQVANYLHFMFKNKYITSNTNKVTDWYEFVTENDSDISPGQLYKWRFVGAKPDTLSKYISFGGLDQVLSRILTDIDNKRMNEEDKDKKALLDALRTRFVSSANSIFNASFKKGVFEEAETLFRLNSHYLKLDKIPQIMGVGNGIIEFTDHKVKLIDHYHTYPISLYTSTEYHPYDENNQYVKAVYSLLRSMFIEEEYDALEFLLYYLSTTLDGFPKDSLIFILSGIGCHAINTPVIMYDGSIKMVQNVKIGDRLMGDDSLPRVVQQLYNGKDTMVRINTDNNETFVVNINHVLSFKFNNLTYIMKNYNNTFKLTWYEYEDNLTMPPCEKYKIFNLEDDAEKYLNNLYLTNSKIVNRGDIIDIKVSDLLKWPNNWLTTNAISLYKSNKLEFSNQNLTIAPYNLGFCLYTEQISPILLNNKHIPHVYKTSSLDQRLELLAGIIDAAGVYHANTNQYEVTLTVESLIDDCIWVARSLGYAAYHNSNAIGKINIYGNYLNMIPVRFQQKAFAENNQQTALLHNINSIEIIGDGEYYGFELDSNHRYLTNDFTVHHNSNGKTVLLEFIRETLGEQYIRKLPISFLTEQQRNKSAGADPAMMDLKYARMAYYSESSQNEKINLSRMKELTGKETMSSRQLFKGQENFKPNCNHMVTTNHKFSIDSTDHAVWRRILTYTFKIVFMPKLKGQSKYERLGDTKLTDKCLTDKRYQEAFLSILVHYRCMLYEKYDGKLHNVPKPTIDKETTIYRNREDIFNRFLDQKCYYSKHNIQSMDEMLALFRAYYKLQNNEPFKKNNDELKSIFMNSKITKYFVTENGITRLHNLKIVEEGFEPMDGEILLTEWKEPQ